MGYGQVDLGVLPGFVAAVLILLLAPGPDMAFMVATGLRDGRRGATRAALGITAGVGVYVVLYVVLTALGLGAFLAGVPGITPVIRIGGAVYLAYLAWVTWRSGGHSPETPGIGGEGAFRRGFIVNISNPKIMLFFTAFLPQFLGDATGNPVVQLLMLGLVLQVLGLLADLAIGYAAGAVRDRVLAGPRIRTLMDRLAASVYGALAAALLVDTAR